MTIKINGSSFNGIDPLNRVKKNEKTEKGTTAAQSGIDRVQFSSVIAETMRAKEVSATTESARAEKLQSLKEQIADGSYSPDSTKVATSLLKFLAENQAK
ncbi:MAG: flagellar biosynthesis anti-sigma factor FlgM [Pedobacter sp.]|jgi:negative regulator of flagellin synthesis FlgM